MKGHELGSYETASVIVVVLFYNFTNVKMKGPNKLFEIEFNFIGTTFHQF